MKKQLFGLLTAGLLLSACSQEDVMAPQGDGNVTFTVSLEQGIMSRAISDGTTATDLTYEVYNQAGDQLITSGTAQFTSTTTPVEVKVTLPMGNYKIAFWAQSPQATAYTATDLRNVTIDYDGILNNDENLDAFFNATEFNTSVSQPVSVVLRRPFAQINVGIDGDVDYTQSQMVVKNGGFNALNVLTGVASGDETEITFEMANLPTEKLTVSETEYTYLSMTYLLVNTASTTVDLELTLTGDKQYTYDNVPVQRNHRTNILGKVENFEVVFQVTKDSNYDGDLDGNAESEEPEEPEADEVTYSNLTANYSDGTVSLSVDFEGDAQKINNPQFVLTPKVASRAAGEITVTGSVSGSSVTGTYSGELTATAYTVSFQVNGEPVELEGDPETPSFDVPAVTEPAEPVPASGTVLWGETFGDFGVQTTTFAQNKTIAEYDYQGRTGYKDNAENVTYTADESNNVRITTSSAGNMVSANMWFNKSVNGVFTTSAIKLYGATSLQFSFSQTKGNAAYSYSTDGSQWTPLGTQTAAIATQTYDFDVPADTESVMIKIEHPSSNGDNTRVDNITLKVK